MKKHELTNAVDRVRRIYDANERYAEVYGQTAVSNGLLERDKDLVIRDYLAHQVLPNDPLTITQRITLQNSGYTAALACAADLLNQWCRELGVPECENPLHDLELRDAIDRVWAKVSSRTPAEPTIKSLVARNGVGPIESYTCHDCSQWQKCEFAFDGYNTNGDCLADK